MSKKYTSLSSGYIKSQLEFFVMDFECTNVWITEPNNTWVLYCTVLACLCVVWVWQVTTDGPTREQPQGTSVFPGESACSYCVF